MLFNLIQAFNSKNKQFQLSITAFLIFVSIYNITELFVQTRNTIGIELYNPAYITEDDASKKRTKRTDGHTETDNMQILLKQILVKTNSK